MNLQLDARVLESGDLYLPAPFYARRVVRSRQIDGATEITHGNPSFPGGLEYSTYKHGERVVTCFRRVWP